MRQPARCLIYPVLLLAVAPGCQALHAYRPVSVLARDADTKKPIAGAAVRLSYPLTDPTRAPWDAAGPTGGDGIARLRAAPYGTGLTLEVNASGYLTELQDLSVEAIQAIPPAGLFEAVGRRPASFLVELYAEPRPTVELIVPAGYLGLVKAQVQGRADAPCPPGARCFRFAVPQSGVVTVSGPPLLRHVLPTDFRLAYADGAPLSRNARDSEPGFWWLRCEGGYHVFLVGMRNAYDALRRASGEDDLGGGLHPGRGRRHGAGDRARPLVNPALMTQ